MKTKLLRKIRKEIYLIYSHSSKTYKAIVPSWYGYSRFAYDTPPNSECTPLTDLQVRQNEIFFLRENRLRYAREKYGKYAKKIIIR